MDKIEQLKTTSKIVLRILETEPQTRNSDSYLYLKVLEYYDKIYDACMCKLPVETFLINMGEYSIPNFETVRRSRQKIQAEYPDLAACKTVQAYKESNEQAYRAFAKG